MNIDFGKSHMETLGDLMKIAEKHNCTITFGVTSDHEVDVEEGVLKENGFTAELVAELLEKMIIEDAASTFDKVWFELYDKNTGTHNTMAYIESSTYFTAKREEDFLEDEPPSYELLAELEKHDILGYADQYTISDHYSPTIIHGFGNKEKVEDFRVYRPGMALKFFGDLVCDYLKEPRIQRCY